MTAIIKLIASAFLSEIITAAVAYFQARRDDAKSRELGKLEAERDAAIAAARVANGMDHAPLPEQGEMVRRLRDGIG
jgi:hypothetical protein